MSCQKLKEFLKNLNVYKSKRLVYLKNHFPNVLKEIEESTRFLDETNKKGVDISFQERVYCIEHDLSERPICKHCGINHVYFRKDENRFRDFCSSACSKSSTQVKNRRADTLERLYGSRNFNNVEKSRQTRRLNNGSWHARDFLTKRKATMVEKYGVDNWNNPEKTKRTCIERYGVDAPLKSKEIQERTRDSFLKNHPGMNSTMDIPEVREKVIRGTRTRSWKYVANNPLVEPLFSMDDYLSCTDPTKTEFEFRCRKCGNIFRSNWDNGTSKLCEICHPGLKWTSESEHEIVDFLKSIIPDGWTVHNGEPENRDIITPKKIDIVVCDPETNIRLLVDYDGLYFHSDSNSVFKDRNYHLNKTNECESKNLQLIHIFENEWLTKREIVCSRLKNLLGIYDKVIYARGCDVRDMGMSDTEMFLDENHLQGNCTSSCSYGLYHNDDLVSVMTFGRSRFNKKYEWELLRFCNHLGYHVVGGAGKLLRHFERKMKPKSLLSYADRRWSVGKPYHRLGFTLDHKSEPNYWYFRPSNPSVLFNRLRYRKTNQNKLLENFNPELSEVENMHNNGFLRIFDCGNLVFVKNYQKVAVNG